MAADCVKQPVDAISAIVFPLADPRISYSRGWERPAADSQQVPDNMAVDE